MYNNHRIVATIEARMASTRLPGKVLLPLAGESALVRLVERIQRSQYVDQIVVATTIHPADEAIVRVCERIGVACHRGSQEDVLQRVLDAAQIARGDILVEITGDCPLLDYELIDRGIEEFFKQSVDYASNDLEPGFPVGTSVQVFPVAKLAEVARLTQDPIDRVHVSYYLYTHPERYTTHAWLPDQELNWPELRITLDEPADYELIYRVYEALWHRNPNFTLRDVVTYLRKQPELVKINEHVRQKNAQEG